MLFKGTLMLDGIGGKVEMLLKGTLMLGGIGGNVTSGDQRNPGKALPAPRFILF
jgi:hypothetical protein